MASASSSSVTGQVWPSLVPAGERVGKPAVELARAVVLIGSEPYNHIRIASSTVSRSHALILNSDGGSYIRDLMSRSGLLVNGEKVREKALFDGDLIQIGRYSFTFQAGMVPESGKEAPAAQLKIGNFVLPVNQRAIVIGRRAGCDLILDNDLVSTVHAVIFTMNGRHVVRDLHSKNGTRLNNQKIHQMELKPVDVLRIGGTEIIYSPDVKSGRAADRAAAAPAAAAAPGRAAAAAALAAATEAAVAPLDEEELLPPAAAAAAAAAPAAKAPAAVDDLDIDELLGTTRDDAAAAAPTDGQAGAASAEQPRPTVAVSDQLQVNGDDLIPVEPPSAAAAPAAADDFALELLQPETAGAGSVEEPERAASRAEETVEAEAPLPMVFDEPMPEEPALTMTTGPGEGRVSATDDAMPLPVEDAEATSTTEAEAFVPPLPVTPVEEVEPAPTAERERERGELNDLDLDPANEPAQAVEVAPVELARERFELSAPPADLELDDAEAAVEEFEDELAAPPVPPPVPVTEGVVEEEAAPAVDLAEVERARNTPAAEPMSPVDVDELAGELPVATTRGGAAPEPVMSQQADSAAADMGAGEIADTLAPENAFERVADTVAPDLAFEKFAETSAPEPSRATMSGDVADERVAPPALHIDDAEDVSATPMGLRGEAETSAAPAVDDPAEVDFTFDAFDRGEASPSVSLDETVTGGDADEARIEVAEEAEVAARNPAEFESPTVGGDARAAEVGEVIETRGEEGAEDAALSFLDEPAESVDRSEVSAEVSGEVSGEVSAEAERPAVLVMDDEPAPILDENDITEEGETLAVGGVPATEPLQIEPLEEAEAEGEGARDDSIVMPTLEAPDSESVVEPVAESVVEPVQEELTAPVAPRDEQGWQPGRESDRGEVEATDDAFVFGEEPEDGRPTLDVPAPVDEPVAAVEREDLDGAWPAVTASAPGLPADEPVVTEAPIDEPAPVVPREPEVGVRNVEAAPPAPQQPPRAPRAPQPFFVTMSDASTTTATPPGMFFVTVAGGTVPAAVPPPAAPPRVQIVQLPLESPAPRSVVMPSPVAPPRVTPPAPPARNTTATVGDLGRGVEGRDVSYTDKFDDADDDDLGMIDEDAVGLLDDPLEFQDAGALDDETAEALQTAAPVKPPAAPRTEQPAGAEVADDAPVDALLDETSDDAMSIVEDDDDETFAKRPLTEASAAKGAAEPVVDPAAAAAAREQSRRRLRDTVSPHDSAVDVFSLHADLQPPETAEAEEALETSGLPNRQPRTAPRHVPPNPAKWGPVAGAVAGTVMKGEGEPEAERAPATPRKRVTTVVVLLVIGMVLAALAVWKFVLPHVLVEATMQFDRLAEIDATERNGFQDQQLALLRDEYVRKEAVRLLQASEPSPPQGFLGDTNALFERMRPTWELRDAGKMALVVKYSGTDVRHDAARLSALLEAVYQNEFNQKRLRESDRVRGALAAKKKAFTKAQEELEALDRRKREYQAVGDRRPETALLASLRQARDRVEAEYNAKVAARKALQAELARMQQGISAGAADATADSTADATAAAERSDSDLTRMVQELEEKKRRLDELGSGLGSKAAAARGELSDAVDQFQSNIKAMQEMMKDNPALNDYVASAQRLHEAAWKFQGDLIERQEKQQQRLVDYKRRLEEQMERRKQEVMANDPDLKELAHLLDLKTREHSAAEQSGLKKEAAKVKEQLDIVKQQIEARRMTLGEDAFYKDAIAELKGIIDTVEKTLASDREASERTMAELETSFRLRGPEVERLPQAQRALAEQLAKRALAIQQARKAYAEATAERDVDANAQLKTLQSEVATLEGKVAARRKEILAEQQKRLGEQQQEEIRKLEARIAEAEKAEALALESNHKALKELSDVEAKQRAFTESALQLEEIQQVKLPEAKRRYERADAELVAEQQAVQKIVRPLSPGKAKVADPRDHRVAIIGTAWGVMIALAGGYLLFSSPRSPATAAAEKPTPAPNEEDEETAPRGEEVRA